MPSLQPSTTPDPRRRNQDDLSTFLAVVLAIIFGGGFVLFLVVISFGLFLWVIAIALGVMVFVGVHYLLWGRRQPREQDRWEE